MRHRRGAIVNIKCSEPSHPGGRIVQIAAFQELLDATGRRVGIDVLRHRRRTKGGVLLVTDSYDGPWVVDVGTDDRDRGALWPRLPSGVIESVIDPDGRKMTGPIEVDDETEGRWHYQLRCRLCGLNVSRRRERLMPSLAKLMDAGESSEELATLARILA